MTLPPLPSPGAAPLSVVLFHLAHDQTRERVAIGDLLGALGDRALGALMFVFAAPNIFPVPPGVSTVLGAPLLFLSLQLMLGLKPWLPKVVAQRSLARDDLAAMVRRLLPWLQKAERLLRPRGRFMVRPPMENLAGLVCLLLAVVLMLPVPLGNTLPALAIALMGLGVLERDGLWMLAGWIGAAVATAVVSGVVWAMIQGGLALLARLT